jgi:hypothetical protein
MKQIDPWSNFVKYPPEQKERSLEVKAYTNRIVVCGTRKYNDRHKFHSVMLDYLETFESPVLFISGAAPSGADDLIIRWCMKFNYPCLEVPADWDRLGQRAGFERNNRMVKIATHVVAFWDGRSPGTKHMLEITSDLGLPEKIILINQENNGKQNPQKSVLVAGCAV